MAQVQVGEEIVLLSPSAERDSNELPPAPRLPSLKGASITIINAFNDQERSNAELFSQHVGEILRREGAGQIIEIRKNNTSGSDLPQETVDHIASQSQGAVILEGD